MIRATRSGFYDLAQNAAARQNSELRSVQEKAITGLAINRPSDDPDALSEVHRLRAAAGNQDVYTENSNRAADILNTTDQALSTASNAMLKAREIAVQAANGTYNDVDRKNLADVVGALRTTLINAANTEYDGHYLFGGTAYDQIAFDDTGTYQGTADAPMIEIGPGQYVHGGAVGSDVFQGAADAFQTLSDLQTALETNDITGVRNSLTNIDLASDQITATRVSLGAESATADDALTLSTALRDVLAGRLGELVNADPVETYTDLTQLQTTYQSTLQVTASVGSKTLFDML